MRLWQISNLPEKVTEDDIDGLMAGAGFPLKSVTLEEGGKSAFMRLAVPKPSAKPAEKAEPPSEEAVKEEAMPAAESQEAAKEAVKEGEGAAKKEEGGEKKEEAEVEIPAADYYNDPDKVASPWGRATITVAMFCVFCLLTFNLLSCRLGMMLPRSSASWASRCPARSCRLRAARAPRSRSRSTSATCRTSWTRTRPSIPPSYATDSWSAALLCAAQTARARWGLLGSLHTPPQMNHP